MKPITQQNAARHLRASLIYQAPARRSTCGGRDAALFRSAEQPPVSPSLAGASKTRGMWLASLLLVDIRTFLRQFWPFFSLGVNSRYWSLTMRTQKRSKKESWEYTYASAYKVSPHYRQKKLHSALSKFEGPVSANTSSRRHRERCLDAPSCRPHIHGTVSVRFHPQRLSHPTLGPRSPNYVSEMSLP